MGTLTVNATNGATVAAGASYTVPYPAGKSAADYLATGAKITTSDGSIYSATVSLGASSITITNPTGRAIASGGFDYLDMNNAGVVARFGANGESDVLLGPQSEEVKLVRSTTDPLTGGIKSFGASGVNMPVASLPGTVSLIGANKWFGAKQNTNTFNETGVFASANYGGGLKIEAEAPFSAVRLVWVSRAANAMTASKAIVGATEAMDYSTATTAFHPVVGGSLYNSLATTTQVNGYKTVTWGGNATVDHPAANLAAQVKISDRIPCSSVPRSAADQAAGYNRPLLIIRGEHDGSTNGAFATFSNGAISVMKDPIVQGRRRVLQLFTGTNLVSTPSAVNGAIGTVTYEIFPIFEYDVPSLNVLGVGDSLMGCDAIGCTGVVTSWGWRGCADASSVTRPVSFMNGGASGRTYPEYWLRAQELVTAGLIPDVLLIQPLSINDYSGNTAELDYRIEIGKSRAKEAVYYARANGIRKVCFMGLLPYNTLGLSADNLRKGYNSWLSAFAESTLNGYLNFSPLGDGASPERWVPAYSFDSSIHANELAIETVMAPVLTAWLKTIP